MDTSEPPAKALKSSARASPRSSPAPFTQNCMPAPILEQPRSQALDMLTSTTPAQDPRTSAWSHMTPSTGAGADVSTNTEHAATVVEERSEIDPTPFSSGSSTPPKSNPGTVVELPLSREAIISRLRRPLRPELSHEAALKRLRDEFDRNSYSQIIFPAEVRLVLSVVNSQLVEFLHRQTPQRDPARRNHESPQYDALHFQISKELATQILNEPHPGYDKIISRKHLHHDIARAVHKLNAAEDQILKDGYSLLSSQQNSHLIILFTYLRKMHLGHPVTGHPSSSYSVYHDTDKCQLILEEPTTEEEMDIQPEDRQVLYASYPEPQYVSSVTGADGLSAILAYEGLTQKNQPSTCHTFLVRRFSGKTGARRFYYAYAFFNEFVREDRANFGKLDFSVDVRYVDLGENDPVAVGVEARLLREHGRPAPRETDTVAGLQLQQQGDEGNGG